MKFETAMLKTFFAAGVVTCLLMLGSFVVSPANHAAPTAPALVAAAR
jgi:dolichol kinase